MQRHACDLRFFSAVETDKCEPRAAGDRTKRTDWRAARDDLRAGRRQRPPSFHADDAFPRSTAMLHARHHLLADEAALLEVDAVQLIEHRLMREGVAESVVAAALGHAKRNAAGVILILAGERAAKIADIAVGGKQDAEP